MNDFFTSPFIENLKNGELPEVKTTVEIETESMVYLSLFLLVTGAILIIGAKMLR